MAWYAPLAYFFGGALLMNAIPHLVSGVSGRPFPTPFASPPGRGLSSPVVNVLWTAVNLILAYLLVCHVGEFHFRHLGDVAALGTGGLLMGLMLANTFSRRVASGTANH
jgi:hypothetical protein